MRFARAILAALALAVAAVFGGPAAAAEPWATPLRRVQAAPVNTQQPCALGMVRAPGEDARRAWPASFVPAQAEGPPQAGQVRITYLGHSSFLIETPMGASAVTDYNGVHVPPYAPDIATMNNAHTTHYTEFPDPRIGHVLRGWANEHGLRRHDVVVKDLRVFNVPTNIATINQRAVNGNSVFVFQAAGLCLAHLGHLHHLADAEVARAMGRIDVLFLPIDGYSTMSHAEAADAIGQIQPRLVIPIHYHFSSASARAIRCASTKAASWRWTGARCRPRPRSSFSRRSEERSARGAAAPARANVSARRQTCYI
jgi:L-ascorbate metabolism protein UlaG (beta-lactamase superfamily)